ncbi:MAG TPA: NAD(P)/FAD-dependent oxidoreductase [Dehalococcoidia bacterium]
MYDAIVVGARCAGAPTAMLLAREGHKVLLLDRDEFPSDIMSTHFIHLAGKVLLHRWGLLDRVLATDVPPIPKSNLHFGDVVMTAPPLPMPDGLDAQAICPRRYILDKILIDAAVEAGAEFRQGVSVRELIRDGDMVVGVRGHAKDKAPVEERARIVIGADGMHSVVAREVGAEEYDTKPTLTFGYYAYWAGVSDPEMHIYFFEDTRGVLSFPTHDGLSCIGVGGAIENFHEFRKDIEGNYMSVVERVPELAAAMRAGGRKERFIGTADQPNFFRVPYGPGWALVGDAGYHRDFLTGLGITDAFRDAALLSQALHEGFSETRPMEEALAGYQAKRDEIARPLYDFTTKMASGVMPEAIDFMTFGAAMARMINS